MVEFINWEVGVKMLLMLLASLPLAYVAWKIFRGGKRVVTSVRGIRRIIQSKEDV